MSAYLQQRIEALRAVLESVVPPLAVHTAPLRLVSLANGSQGVSHAGLRFRAAKKKQQRLVGQAAGALFRSVVQSQTAAWWVVRLVRVAPRALDSDNLERAFKAIRDGIAEGLRIDDRDPRVRYVADTEPGGPGVYAVRCELYPGAAPVPRSALPPLEWRRYADLPLPPPLTPPSRPVLTPTPNVRKPSR